LPVRNRVSSLLTGLLAASTTNCTVAMATTAAVKHEIVRNDQ